MEQTTIRITNNLHKAMESIKASNESFDYALLGSIVSASSTATMAGLNGISGLDGSKFEDI